MKKEVFDSLKNPRHPSERSELAHKSLDFWGRKIQSIFHVMKDEVMPIGIMLVSGFILFKIVFFNEDLFVLLRFVLSLFWLFALPGYFVMLHWKDKLEFVERFIIGTALSAGIIGISSYYLGLFGLHIKYHAIVLPLAIIIIGLVIAVSKKHNNQAEN